MNVLHAIHVSDLPELPDGSSLAMVFAAKTGPFYTVGELERVYLLQSDLIDQTDAGAIRLLEWMRSQQPPVDLIFE